MRSSACSGRKAASRCGCSSSAREAASPLGVSSAGIAVLAYRSEDEVSEYLRNVDLEQRWGPQHSTRQVLERVEQTRELGYSVNPGMILEGSYGMAAAVFSRSASQNGH